MPIIEKLGGKMSHHSQPRSLRTFALVVLLIFFNISNVLANDDMSLFISKYGQPDQIKSSEHENPRPPFVTKQLIYKKENVRVVYLADAPIGSPPPYKGWKLFGFQDQRTNAVIKADEVVRRLEKRIKK